MTPNESLPFDRDGDDEMLLKECVAFYQRCLAHSQEARAYLARRCIDDPAGIERFRIGYADRRLGLSLPSKDTVEGKQIRDRLQHVGILRSTGHGHLNGCVVFPVIDAEGNIKEIYGRKIGRRLRKSTPLYMYLHEDAAERGLWNPDGLRNVGEIILCHSILEAFTFYCAGYPHVRAAYGPTGFTNEHLTALRGGAFAA